MLIYINVVPFIEAEQTMSKVVPQKDGKSFQVYHSIGLLRPATLFHRSHQLFFIPFMTVTAGVDLIRAGSARGGPGVPSLP
jgi:hypothetical protein